MVLIEFTHYCGIATDMDTVKNLNHFFEEFSPQRSDTAAAITNANFYHGWFTGPALPLTHIMVP